VVAKVCPPLKQDGDYAITYLCGASAASVGTAEASSAASSSSSLGWSSSWSDLAELASLLKSAAAAAWAGCCTFLGAFAAEGFSLPGVQLTSSKLALLVRIKLYDESAATRGTKTIALSQSALCMHRSEL
jgi:hypothetical protein